MKFKVNIVEDEKNLNDLLSNYFDKAGYEVNCFFNFEKALANVENKVDIWLLDVMLDKGSGYELMQAIRNIYPKMPIIIISARDHELDRIIGLEKGCDDYITKPFSAKEVLLRVGNLLKRSYPENEENLIVNDYIIDVKQRKVFDKGQEIILTTKEYELLLLLVNNPKSAFSREQILLKIWGYDFDGTDRVVDDGLRRLRKKLNRLNIQTIYGYGYRLDL